MISQDILIYIIGSLFLLLLLLVILRSNLKNKNLLSKINKLENRNLIQVQNQRVLDSIDLLFENEFKTNENLCNSIRIATESETVVLSVMNPQNGSFQAINSSSYKQIDVSNFEPEYDDKKTLAIVTGIEGTSKVLDNKNNECFPEWFNELEFEQIISLPIINGFETYGCIYIFLRNRNEGELLEKKLKNSSLLIKIFQNSLSENKQQNEIIKTKENKKNINNIIPIFYDDNLQTIRFENNEIALSNSEYLIISKLLSKNGDLLLYEDIEKILWPNNKGINKTAMRLHIHRLREKTNSITSNKDFIKTQRGKGIFIDLTLF